jgi:uncharacterized delta-60 repeat protein
VTGSHRLLLAALVAGLAALAIPGVAFGAAGDLDPSFSGDGKLTTAFGTTPFHAADTGNGAARLATGELYVAGTTPGANGDGDFALVRFTAAGVLDTSFGGGDGIVTTDLSGTGSEDVGNAVSVNTNTGNVVVAGTSSDPGTPDDRNFAVARYTSTGALDSGFGGGDGIVTTDIAGGRNDTGSAVAQVDPSSSSSDIVVAGATDSNPDPEIDGRDFALVAYTSAGALDTSFDGDSGTGDGKVITDLGSADDFVQAVRITSGPKILVAGGTDPTGDDRGDFALARYSASTGVLDNTFDTDGKETLSFSSNAGGSGNGDNATALATDGSGQIIVAGFAGPGNGDFAVARLDGTSGAPDTTFDTDGKQTVTTPSSGSTLNSSDQCYAVAVQTDGKILLAGSEFSDNHWMLARMSDTGVPDSGFGTGGILLTPFGPTTFGGTTFAAAVFVDGTNIVGAGTADDNFAATRYAIADGTLDSTYGVGGKAEGDVISPIPSSETATGVALQPDGKTVVVGPTNAGPTSQFKGDEEFGLARYNADGSLDQGFGVGGLVTTNFATNLDGTGTQDSPAGVALQSDGKIVVAGKTDPAGTDPGDFAVARYLSNGALDPDFGSGGLVTTDFGGVNQGDSGNAIAIEGTPGSAGFRIVVAGTKNVANSATAFAVAVYNENGTPDTTFNTTGKQTTDVSSVYRTSGVALQPDGKVVVSGTAGDFFPAPVNFALVRYGTDGTPDASFGGGDGIVTTDFAGGYDEGDAVAVKDLGAGQVRIVVTGRASPDTSSTADAGVAVYTTDGSLDSSFAPGGTDGDGKLTFDLASSFDALRGVAFQPDGEIVGSGTVESPGFGLARMTSSGSLDPSFGGDGLVSTSFGDPGQNVAAGLALQPDGRIVAAGGPLNAQNGSDFFVARYGDAPTLTTPPTTPPTTTPPTTPKKKCKKGFVKKKVKGKVKCVKKKKR